MKLVSICAIICIFTINCFAQSKENNTTSLAQNYYNSIVKILLVDSVKEKEKPGSGYYGRGSGFIVSDDGIIFTNRHVVEYALSTINYTYFDYGNKQLYTDKDIYSPSDFDLNFYKINYVSQYSIIVQLYKKIDQNDYDLYSAKIIAIDTGSYDGAILKLVAKINGDAITQKFHSVTFGNSDSTMQGDDLCVYGFPQQYEGNIDIMLRDQSTLSCGKHSGFDFVVNKDYGYIKTDAKINSGNSGGPVFNSKGLVIGISSAASNKTGDGFVARINGMYNLIKTDTALLALLTKNGFSKSEKNASETSVIKNPNTPLPSKQQISKYNKTQKSLRSFKGGFFYFKASTAILNNDYFTIEPCKENPTIITNSNGKLNAKNTNKLQLEFGKTFPLWRVNSTNKLSLDFSESFKYSILNFSGSNLYQDTMATQKIYDSDAESFNFGIKGGLMYSKLFFAKLQLDIYYKYGLFFGQSQIGNATLIDPNLSGIGEDEIEFRDKVGKIHSLGVNIHFYNFTIGLEYNLGKASSEYEIFQFEVKQDPVNLNYYPENRKRYYIDGSHKINYLNFSISAPIYNKRRWKRVAVKD